MTIQSTTPVGQLVAENPARSRVFESLGIDYCCGGKVGLDEACRRKGLDIEDALRRLENPTPYPDPHARDAPATDPRSMTLTDLADHIEQTHHLYLRSELPRIERLTHKVADAHAARDQRLARLRETVVCFRQDMFDHMLKEERILFPMIRALDSGVRMDGFHCGSIENPIRQMETEHDQSGDTLARMRELTDGYTVPANACNTHRALLDALAHLEQDTHQHVHKENNVLFPAAVRAERDAGA